MKSSGALDRERGPKVDQLAKDSRKAKDTTGAKQGPIQSAPEHEADADEREFEELDQEGHNVPDENPKLEQVKSMGLNQKS